VVSCHLGGSSSVTGILNGVAIGTSMGFSPQSGLPQNNRVGELDSGAIPYAMRTLGISLDEAERQLTKESGLLGLSGVSNDIRDIVEAAGSGNPDAQLALDASSTRSATGSAPSCSKWAASTPWSSPPASARTTPPSAPRLRRASKASASSSMPPATPPAAPPRRTSSRDSRARILVIPANEELVLAREVFRKLS
jgi:acetate kinase